VSYERNSRSNRISLNIMVINICEKFGEDWSKGVESYSQDKQFIIDQFSVNPITPDLQKGFMWQSNLTKTLRSFITICESFG